MTSKKNETRPEIWSNLLKSVAARTQRSLARKTLLVLGGSVTSTQDFVDTLRQACTESKNRKARKSTVPSKCSEVAAYTYIDIEDADGDETIARVAVYMLPGCDNAQHPALQDFIKGQKPEELILCVLFDWHSPWTWLRSLRSFITGLIAMVNSIRSSDADVDIEIAKNIKELESSIRSFSESPRPDSLSRLQLDPSLARPLDKGEFDRPIGLPLFCIAQNADYTYALEHEHGMKEDHFDFIQQVLRTILLRHGGSLIYTSLSRPESMQIFKRHMLRDFLKQDFMATPNEKIDLATTVIRDQVFVPAGWDSWNKIGVLREGFDVEKISNLWTADLDLSSPQMVAEERTIERSNSAVDLFEEIIVDPTRKHRRALRKPGELEVEPIDRMKVLQELEQRQWEVQESTEEAQEIVDSGTEPFNRPRSRPLPATSLRDSSSMTQAGMLGKTSSSKDEYVQAFFQNLLNRRESERAIEK